MSAGAPLVVVNVTLCVTPSNVNVTVVPGLTVRLVGLNTIVALAMTVFAGGVGSEVVPPPPVFTPVVLELPPAPHAATSAIDAARRIPAGTFICNLREYQ